MAVNKIGNALCFFFTINPNWTFLLIRAYRYVADLISTILNRSPGFFFEKLTFSKKNVWLSSRGSLTVWIIRYFYSYTKDKCLQFMNFPNNLITFWKWTKFNSKSVINITVNESALDIRLACAHMPTNTNKTASKKRIWETSLKKNGASSKRRERP